MNNGKKVPKTQPPRDPETSTWLGRQDRSAGDCACCRRLVRPGLNMKLSVTGLAGKIAGELCADDGLAVALGSISSNLRWSEQMNLPPP